MQEWTKLENPSAEGVVKRHRSGSQPESPPDNHTIQMKMAIVSWQPGPNRVLQVPNQACFLHVPCIIHSIYWLPCLPFGCPHVHWLEMNLQARAATCLQNSVTVASTPMQDEVDSLKPGCKSKREPARPRIDFTEVEGQRVELPDISQRTTEALTCTDVGDVFLDRRDVWAAEGWDEDPLLFRRP